jgi:succinoglycan biosynthesis transport protein ExoP
MTSSPKITSPGLGLTDFLISAFKHKWKVLVCTIAGIAAATAFYITNPPQYESDAKILVKYVLEHSAVDSMEGQGQNAAIPNRPNDAVLNSEVEILNSWDLFEQVAEEVGPSRLCPTVPNATDDNGARTIAAGLTVASVPDSDVILITYKSSSPELAPEVLQSLLEAYFSQHLAIHRSKAAFDLVSQQTDIIRGELEKTEDDIKKKKAEADIISVQDTANNINTELANTEREIDSQQTALAAQTALVNELQKAMGGGDGNSPSTSAPKAKPVLGAAPAITGSSQDAVPVAIPVAVLASPNQVEQYKELLQEIDDLQKRQADLLVTYSEQALPVQMNKTQLASLQKQRQDMESAHPELMETALVASPTSSHTFDIAAERARLVSLQAGMKALEARLATIQQRARDFAKVAPDISELERTEQLQEADYDNSQTKLQNATVDEALDPSKIPNISIVQKPSPAMKVAGKRQKAILALAGGGFAIGYGLALLIEIVLNQTVRRPVELEQRLGIPLWLSIPFTSNNSRTRRLPAPAVPGNGSDALVVSNGNAEIAPWEVTHFVRPYAETIRDRLGLYFETNNMTHRPKLLAITGSGGGAGTSTLAAGIASALSETGEGKVLLVDMNPGRTEAHPFFQGRPACSLSAALSNEGKLTSAADNLYLATASQNGSGTGSFGLKRLRELIPNIKESDFDYVLFDMPPLGQTSPTASMAAYMDNVIFVVEAENAQRDTVKRDYNQLIGRKPDVLVVLNKTRSYAPKWIDKGS